ncbi:Uncharacterized protein KIAA0195 [Anas platyrhynchos]|uniref:Uncharacterized protein KIAA0195 n=1 Tax=Anas platyrhynchos TaxID=8839 RepID=R0KTX8_ANAPL|nr:Uncharacterized protein KIAA0195 [Anas platyrhynchos]
MPEEGIGEVMEKEDCIQALSGQIFMGMVSSQYQARLDIVRLIDGLVNACIRFVYFSLEDELKSKVFAEKMGLETGWNCHISLTPNGDVPGSEIPPSSPSHAGSLHDDLHQVSRDDVEGLLLMEEEGHSDLISFQPTDSDIPSFLEDCNRLHSSLEKLISVHLGPLPMCWAGMGNIPTFHANRRNFLPHP